MGRFDELRQLLRERRVGFRIDEQMEGTHRFVRDFPPSGQRAGDEQPLRFSATWGHPHLGAFLRPLGGDFLRANLTGHLTAGGLCEEAPVTGELELRYFTDATIRYRFQFQAHGRRFGYEGEKRNLRPWNLHRTHTTCYGAITDLDDGQLLSESVVRFDLLKLPSFLGSWRLG